MSDILLTNDDGYNSIGYFPLLKNLSEEFSVFAVAPSKQQSWVGKSITAHGELVQKEIEVEGVKVISIDGTPADCVQVGVYHLLQDKPKLVVSGINIGENVGHGRILSSGTVGAAMEAAIDGIRSISASLYIPSEIKKDIDFFDRKNYHLFENAAKIIRKIVKITIETAFDPSIDLISVNIPFEASVETEVAITVPFREPYGQLFHKQGQNLIHINPKLAYSKLDEGTDIKALLDGKISITPINLELVSKNSMEALGEQIKGSW